MDIQIQDVEYTVYTEEEILFDASLKKTPALLQIFNRGEADILMPELKIHIKDVINPASAHNRFLLGFYERYYPFGTDRNPGAGCYRYRYMDIRKFCTEEMLEDFLFTCNDICKEKQTQSPCPECMKEYKESNPFACLRAAGFLSKNETVKKFLDKLFCTIFRSTDKEMYFCMDEKIRIRKSADGIKVRAVLVVKEIENTDGTETEKQVVYADELPLSSSVMNGLKIYLKDEFSEKELIDILDTEPPVCLEDMVVNKIMEQKGFQANGIAEHSICTCVPTILPDEAVELVCTI